jgi:hypothetical protein
VRVQTKKIAEPSNDSAKLGSISTNNQRTTPVTTQREERAQFINSRSSSSRNLWGILAT